MPLHACGLQLNHKVRIVYTWFSVVKSLRLKLEVVKFSKFLTTKPCPIFQLPCTPSFPHLYFLGFTASILWVVEVASPLYAMQEDDDVAFHLDSVFL